MGWTINSLSPIHAPKVVFLSLSFRIGGSVLQFSGLCAGHTFSSWQAPIAQQHWRCDHHIDHAFPRVRLVLHAAGESNSPKLQQLFVVVTPKKCLRLNLPILQQCKNVFRFQVCCRTGETALEVMSSCVCNSCG